MPHGHDVVIRRVPDQWFLAYGNAEWKEQARALIARCAIRPAEYARELPGVLDWFNDRPCTRKGRWLGTPFPLDPSWVIEPIADSTFYPAYYPIRPFVADGRVALASLTDAFFDHAILGRGDGEPTVPTGVRDEVRRTFTHFYPLDANIGGKEHKRVHFPLFLYTHALLLPEELQPKGLFVHWWVTGGGEKISKKQVSGKGGSIPPIRAALARWGADALRVFYLTAASPSQDVEWDADLVDAARVRIDDVERMVRSMREPGSDAPPELDRWFVSSARGLVERSRTAYESYEFRDAAEIAFGEIPALVRRYHVRGGAPGATLERLSDIWVRLLSPLVPHLAEELGEGRFAGLVAAERFPDLTELARDERAEAAEEYLSTVEDDLQHVLTPAIARGEPPGEVVFFVAASWKSTVEGWLRELASERTAGVPIPEIMKRAQSHPEVAAFRAVIPKYVGRVAPLIRSERPVPSVHELDVLRSATGYFVRRFKFVQMTVLPESEAEPHDPMGKRERARPGRPAFYLASGALRR